MNILQCNDYLDIDPLFTEAQEQMSVEQMVLRAINKYKDYPSIKVINQHSTSNGNSFKLSHVSPKEVMKQIDLLDKNISNSGNILTGMLKAARGIVCPYVKAGLHDHIHVQFASHFYVITEWDRANGLYKLLKVM